MSQIRRAILFSSTERYATVALSIMQIAIVSRLLDAQEMGLAAIGLAVVQLIDAMRDFGTINYLVQREDMTRDAGRSVFTVLLIGSGAAAVALGTLAQPIGAYYGQTGVRDFLMITAGGLLITPFATPLLAMMRRELQFGELAIVNAIAAAVQALVLVGLAAAGYGALSFAWAMAAWNAACLAGCLWRRPDLRWMYAPKLSGARQALAFGSVSSATTVFHRIYDLLPVFVLGRLFPIETVGLYNRAMLVAQLPDRLLFSSVSNVVLPALSHTAREGGSLKDAYLSALGYITVVQWPVLIAIAALAHPIVSVLLGSQWLEVVPIVQLTALASLFYFPSILHFPMLVASGGVRDTLQSSVINLMLGALIVVASAPWGPIGIAASHFVAMPLFILVELAFIRRRTPFRWREAARALRKSAIVTACAGAAPAAAAVASGPGFVVELPMAAAAGLGAVIGWLIGAAAVRHPILEHVGALLRSLVAGATAAKGAPAE